MYVSTNYIVLNAFDFIDFFFFYPFAVNCSSLLPVNMSSMRQHTLPLHILALFYITVCYHVGADCKCHFCTGVMTSHAGPRAAGTDGSDFKHREKVAPHYQMR